MAPEVTVMDAESESDNIKIGNHRADSTSDPDSSRHARAVETGTNAEGGNRMRKRRCHLEPPELEARVDLGDTVFHTNPLIKTLTGGDLNV